MSCFETAYSCSQISSEYSYVTLIMTWEDKDETYICLSSCQIKTQSKTVVLKTPWFPCLRQTYSPTSGTSEASVSFSGVPAVVTPALYDIYLFSGILAHITTDNSPPSHNL